MRSTYPVNVYAQTDTNRQGEALSPDISSITWSDIKPLRNNNGSNTTAAKGKGSAET
jgi:hypothetical protein